MATRCPICHKKTGTYRQPDNLGNIGDYELPLYQVSYPGTKEYVSERCIECYEQVERRRNKGGVN